MLAADAAADAAAAADAQRCDSDDRLRPRITNVDTACGIDY